MALAPVPIPQKVAEAPMVDSLNGTRFSTDAKAPLDAVIDIRARLAVVQGRRKNRDGATYKRRQPQV